MIWFVCVWYCPALVVVSVVLPLCLVGGLHLVVLLM